jgi:hypothetical protein
MVHINVCNRSQVGNQRSELAFRVFPIGGFCWDFNTAISAAPQNSRLALVVKHSNHSSRYHPHLCEISFGVFSFCSITSRNRRRAVRHGTVSLPYFV